MASEADYGFMIWDGCSKGTTNNISNLLNAGKMVLVFLTNEQAFYTFREIGELEDFFGKRGAPLRGKITHECQKPIQEGSVQSTMPFTD